MARGVAPSVFSFDINPTQAISGRSSGSRIFSPPATNPGGYVRNRPSFWGIYSKPVPSASLSRYSVGPALSGDFRGLYFSLQHDVWSRTMKALFVLLCPTAAGNASDYGEWLRAEARFLIAPVCGDGPTRVIVRHGTGSTASSVIGSNIAI